MDLTMVLAGIIVFGIGAYVILDGFDLGVGILFPLMPDEAARDTAIASVAPVWDGNETWLILSGAVLFGAFPLAYAIALPAFYVPVMTLLVALIFRGVAFEFRIKAKATRRWWNQAFSLGSTLAAFSQGMILGGLLEGVKIEGRSFAGGHFDWLTPFSLVTGLGVVAGYALIGAAWLNLKSEGSLQLFARRWASLALVASLLALVSVSLYTPWKFPDIAERWFGNGNWLPLLPVPVATAAVSIMLIRELRRGSHYAPFFYTIALFLLGYAGIGISLWPHILPPALTVFDAAAPASSQRFVLVAVALSLPMILIYTAYAYWVFRGKIEPGATYEH
ncbi:MAG: cytochrome d ubiquinol oxidase subunit II [Panacagrimonas sp.]